MKEGWRRRSKVEVAYILTGMRGGDRPASLLKRISLRHPESQGTCELPLLSPARPQCSGNPQPRLLSIRTPLRHSSVRAHRQAGSPVSPIDQRLRTLRLQLQPLQEQSQLRRRKRLLAQALSRRYHCVFAPNALEHLSESELLMKARTCWARRVAKKCAVHMRKWLTQRQLERETREMRSRRHMAAYVIQRHWKRYHHLQVKKAWVSRRIQAATCIQRHVRGYLARLLYTRLHVFSTIQRIALHFRVVRRISSNKDSVSNIFRYWVSHLYNFTHRPKPIVCSPTPASPEISQHPKSCGPQRRKMFGNRRMSVVVSAAQRRRPV